MIYLQRKGRIAQSKLPTPKTWYWWSERFIRGHTRSRDGNHAWVPLIICWRVWSPEHTGWTVSLPFEWINGPSFRVKGMGVYGSSFREKGVWEYIDPPFNKRVYGGIWTFLSRNRYMGVSGPSVREKCKWEYGPSFWENCIWEYMDLPFEKRVYGNI